MDISLKEVLNCRECSHKNVCRLTSEHGDKHINFNPKFEEFVTIKATCIYFRKIENPFTVRPMDYANGGKGLKTDGILRRLDEQGPWYTTQPTCATDIQGVELTGQTTVTANGSKVNAYAHAGDGVPEIHCRNCIHNKKNRLTEDEKKICGDCARKQTFSNPYPCFELVRDICKECKHYYVDDGSCRSCHKHSNFEPEKVMTKEEFEKFIDNCAKDVEKLYSDRKCSDCKYNGEVTPCDSCTFKNHFEKKELDGPTVIAERHTCDSCKWQSQYGVGGVEPCMYCDNYDKWEK